MEKIAAEIDWIKRNQEEMSKKIDSILHFIDGNGTPEKGLKVRFDRLENAIPENLDVRLDRIEEKSKRGDWFTRTALAAAIVAFVGAVWSIVTGR